MKLAKSTELSMEEILIIIGKPVDVEKMARIKQYIGQRYREVFEQTKDECAKIVESKVVASGTELRIVERNPNDIQGIIIGQIIRNLQLED